MLLFYTAFPLPQRKPGDNLREAPSLDGISSEVRPMATAYGIDGQPVSSWRAREDLGAGLNTSRVGPKAGSMSSWVVYPKSRDAESPPFDMRV